MRTTVGDSRHRGAEALVDITLLTGGETGRPRLSLFGSGSFIEATYVRGPQRGKRVEHAPRWQGRLGLDVSTRDRFALAVQASYVDPVYADANNSPISSTGVTGRIPAYLVGDVNAHLTIRRGLRAEVGITNVTDRRYFTRRAGGYPGPGLIPADGRQVIAGLRLTHTGAPLTTRQRAQRRISR